MDFNSKYIFEVVEGGYTIKAIIMAGGEGTRLRPLTCTRPKPMVPVCNKPIMAYVLELLARHGITGAGVTLHYLPEEIISYFGTGDGWKVNLSYFIEEMPLGTAGSVKNAEAFLDGTFLVVSGDALTNIDLTEALCFHRERKSMATLVLTRVSHPLEYGVAITDKDDRIVRFLEKPGWGEVFSDTVNTGIYVLEPDVLELIPRGKVIDFSRDLFPLMLKKKLPLLGLVAGGYWCDIGNISSYLQAQKDALTGRAGVALPGQEIRPGIRVGSGAGIDGGARLECPVLLGDDCVIEENVSIGAGSVIGSGCHLRAGASIKRSVILSCTYVGPSAELRGCILGSGVNVLSGAKLYDGAVLADRAMVGEMAQIKPHVKVWPARRVDEGVVLTRSVIWGESKARQLFGPCGLSGIANIEVSPALVVNLGLALGSSLPVRAHLAVSTDGHPASQMLKDALSAGLVSAGAAVYDLGKTVTPVHRFAVRAHHMAGGVHVCFADAAKGRVNMIITDGRGANIARSMERKLDNLLSLEEFRHAPADKMIYNTCLPLIIGEYLSCLLQHLDGGCLHKAPFQLKLYYDGPSLDCIIPEMIKRLGMDANSALSGAALDWEGYRQLAARVSEEVAGKGATIGALISPDAESLILIDEKGRIIEGDLLIALAALISFKGKNSTVVVPLTTSHVIEQIAGRYGGKVVRTKAGVQDFFEGLLANDDMSSPLFLQFDALAILAEVLTFAAGQKIPLCALIDEIPAIFTSRAEVVVPWPAKGMVIRKLLEETAQDKVELIDGVKVFHPQGWVLVLPDAQKPVLRVFSEGVNMEAARSLADFYARRVDEISGKYKNKSADNALKEYTLI